MQGIELPAFSTIQLKAPQFNETGRERLEQDEMAVAVA